MQIHHSLSRLSAFFLVFLSSLALFACASPLPQPAAAVAVQERGLVPRGTCVVGCTTGAQTHEILVQLQADINIQLGLLGMFPSTNLPCSTTNAFFQISAWRMGPTLPT